MSQLNSTSTGGSTERTFGWAHPLGGSSQVFLEQPRQVLPREDLGTSCSFPFAAEQRPVWMRELLCQKHILW